MYGILTKAVIRILKITYFKIEIEGIENINSNISTIFVSNHESLLDGFLLFGLIPFNVFPFVHGRYFNRYIYKKYLEGCGAIAVNMGVDNRKTIENLNKITKNKNKILIFPEGRVNENHEEIDFKSSFIKIARNYNMEINPIAISGTKNSISLKSRFMKPATIKIRILKSIKVARNIENSEISILRDKIRKEIYENVNKMNVLGKYKKKIITDT